MSEHLDQLIAFLNQTRASEERSLRSLIEAEELMRLTEDRVLHSLERLRHTTWVSQALPTA